ncbi:transketolase [Pleomorphomonas diazotrophica]|uniref:Transketolase n=1 Tax=Pleomorphomonas diazotrophica TaxID=1166257 RepID=A0A1I4VMP8_9HYPH|nr:transketolase C-terminal domain-containing protein [Pleomorphomonas diazotrophica]PKR89600.1 transketolase [Pleomorphomonas diazotrophica]SFN02541.1 transketolase subunit B [Pleomorphomonas diazotrophica]
MSAATKSVEGLYDCRDAFAKTLEALAEADDRVVAVVNDSVGSSKLGGFKKRWPERLVNVGIAEQNMVGVGAGLANGGRIPFVSCASCFLTGRALEQVKADVAYSNTNVKLCGQSPGIGYGELGPTHHSIEDLAWLRPLANLITIVPSDPWETAEAVRFAAAYEGPVFIRVSRYPVPALQHRIERIEPGKAEVMRDGDDVAILANGVMLHKALRAAEKLAEDGVSARVVNMAWMNPLDIETIVDAAATGAIVTVEEASVRGGLGGAVAETLALRRPVPMEMLGFPGFVPTGTVDFLFDHFGLTAAGIAAAARKAISRKGR